MSGVILMVAVGLWAVVGRWVWRDFVRPRVPDRRARVAAIAFAVAWFVVPVGDEILGAYHFKRLCAEIPPTRYYGPIAVGPGAFFDDEGKPKWKSSEDFARIVIASPSAWEDLWERQSQEQVIASWPIVVHQVRRLQIARATGKVVVESYYRGAHGGLINRKIAGSMLGRYQCFSDGPVPQDDETIEFGRSLKVQKGSNP